MKFWKFSGRLLTATGIIHTIVAIIMGWNVYAGMIQTGLFNSIADNYERAFAFWFLIVGILLILWGETLHRYIRRERRPAPPFVGYTLLLLSILGCIVEPISGFWLFVPQALIILFANKKMNSYY